MTIEEVLAVEEMQIFDRKSVNIEPKALAVPIIAFANADGGTVAIGISDKTCRIEGVDRMCKELEAVGLQAPEYRMNAFMLQVTIRNSSVIDKKPLFQVIDDVVCNKSLTPTISENVKEIVEAFDMNQIFGRKEVKKELGYGDYKAGKAIGAMQSLSIVIPVEGKGKGKYILKEMQCEEV